MVAARHQSMAAAGDACPTAISANPRRSGGKASKPAISRHGARICCASTGSTKPTRDGDWRIPISHPPAARGRATQERALRRPGIPSVAQRKRPQPAGRKPAPARCIARFEAHRRRSGRRPLLMIRAPMKSLHALYLTLPFKRRVGVGGSHEAASVLVVVTRRIGDVLLATPLIRSLKRAWPRRIDRRACIRRHARRARRQSRRTRRVDGHRAAAAA